MGQKVNPISFRLGNNIFWSSNWYIKGKKEYRDSVVSDIKIQEYFNKNASKYSVGFVNIERKQNSAVNVCLHSGKISLVIGKKGENIEQIENQLKNILNVKNVYFKVKELKAPNLNANIVARTIADKIENRQAFKKAARTALDQVIKAGAVGVRIKCSGRLNGAEIARREKYKNGSSPLHTIRANVDYACQEAFTTYGVVGIKVWICKKR